MAAPSRCLLAVLIAVCAAQHVNSKLLSDDNSPKFGRGLKDGRLLKQLRQDGVADPIYAYVVAGQESLEVRSGRPSNGALAWCKYVPSYNTTGWATLELHSNATVSDEEQMEAAGFLEGYVTAPYIWDTYQNRQIPSYCDGQASFCERLMEFFKLNVAFFRSRVTSTENRAFWYQHHMVYNQLMGLMYGYNSQAVHGGHGNVLLLQDFFMLSYAGDLETLETALGRSESTRSRVLGSGSCSAMVKIVGDYKDVLFTHDTWTHFYTMLRIYKYYDLPISTDGLEGSPTTPGHKISFSSYPGFLHSNDDFYNTGAGLAVMETTIGNNNKTLFDAITPNSALYFYRVQVASRLARNGAEWAEYFSMYNSGTYNNQWMVFDYNRFTPGHRLCPGAFTVLEQLPTVIHWEDQTDFLIAMQYWASYNAPFYSVIYNAGNFQSNVDKYGNFFTYAFAPRALIFRRDHHSVVDVKSLMHLMRYNDFKHDEYGRCNCTPPYSGENGIAARSDLNPASGTYPIAALGHRLHGATDCKITTSAMIHNLQAHIISGPTSDEQPVFKWSTSGMERPRSHPDAFTFDFETVTWEEV